MSVPARKHRWLSVAWRLLMFAVAVVATIVGAGFFWLAFSGLVAGLYLGGVVGGIAVLWRCRAEVRRAGRIRT
jgi:hypothetical protein